MLQTVSFDLIFTQQHESKYGCAVTKKDVEVCFDDCAKKCAAE